MDGSRHEPTANRGALRTLRPTAVPPIRRIWPEQPQRRRSGPQPRGQGSLGGVLQRLEQRTGRRAERGHLRSLGEAGSVRSPDCVGHRTDALGSRAFRRTPAHGSEPGEYAGRDPAGAVVRPWNAADLRCAGRGPRTPRDAGAVGTRATLRRSDEREGVDAAAPALPAERRRCGIGPKQSSQGRVGRMGRRPARAGWRSAEPIHTADRRPCEQENMMATYKRRWLEEETEKAWAKEEKESIVNVIKNPSRTFFAQNS